MEGNTSDRIPVIPDFLTTFICKTVKRKKKKKSCFWVLVHTCWKPNTQTEDTVGMKMYEAGLSELN